MYVFVLAVLLCLNLNEAVVKKICQEEKTSKYWLEEGANSIRKELKKSESTDEAKNIVLYIGDGMGVSTVTAARVYKNQRMVNSQLPDVGLFFEHFPNSALMKTHSVDAYVADSASTATSMVTGTKTNSKVIGVGPEVLFENCSSHHKESNLLNIASMFHKKGKSVGIVTTTRITHATPAVMYAHSASRDWEFKVPDGCRHADIALN